MKEQAPRLILGKVSPREVRDFLGKGWTFREKSEGYSFIYTPKPNPDKNPKPDPEISISLIESLGKLSVKSKSNSANINDIIDIAIEEENVHGGIEKKIVFKGKVKKLLFFPDSFRMLLIEENNDNLSFTLNKPI